MTLIRITAPVLSPVTLDEMKDYSHVDSSAEDARILDFIRTAVEKLDGRDGLLGRCLITQVWKLLLDSFPSEIVLPLPPCQAVTGITYIDPAGAQQTLAPSAYEVFGIGSSSQVRILPAFGQSFPKTRERPETVMVQFRAGYGNTPDTVPEPLRAAIKMHAAHLYEHRESVAMGSYVEMPQGYDMLISDYRLWSF